MQKMHVAVAADRSSATVYDVDVVISVRYLVKFREELRFRQRARGAPRDPLMQGCTPNRRRLEADAADTEGC